MNVVLAAILAPYIMVLGIAQDGGYPQAGCTRPDCVAAWKNPALRRHVASLAIVDPISNQRWIIDATPDFATQLSMVQNAAEVGGATLDGILLTHAHIGHYLGLAQLGREVMGAHDVKVYAMPRMRAFLEHNGPWDQLVRLHNIAIESIVERVDVAFVDGTFHDASELPGRDLSEIPHPLMIETMKRLAAYARKVRFIHLNQSNPALHDPSIVKPFQVAKERQRMSL